MGFYQSPLFSQKKHTVIVDAGWTANNVSYDIHSIWLCITLISEVIVFEKLRNFLNENTILRGYVKIFAVHTVFFVCFVFFVQYEYLKCIMNIIYEIIFIIIIYLVLKKNKKTIVLTNTVKHSI